MFKKIYLALLLVALASAQTDFEIATKKYLQDANSKKAASLYEKSCKSDKNAVSCYMAASIKSLAIYDQDSADVQPEILSQTLALYKNACELGYATGCEAAGDLYDAPTLQDETGADETGGEKSAEFYEKACETKNADACLRIAKKYDDAAKFTDALKYYKLACEAGEGEGCYNAADIYESGDATPKNDAQAAKFYDLACQNGFNRGCVKFKKLSK